jgi:hypothetical protein
MIKPDSPYEFVLSCELYADWEYAFYSHVLPQVPSAALGYSGTLTVMH